MIILTLSIFINLAIPFTVFLCIYVTRNFSYWRKKHVEYVKPIPFFGNIFKVFTLQVSIGEFLADLYNTTKKPFLGFFVFDQPFLLIRDPELAKRFLIKDFDYFDDRSVMENRKDDLMGSNILFLLKNPAWRPVRVKLTPVFSTGRMRNMLPLMDEASADLVNYIDTVALKEKSTETREVAMKFTTDVISSCAFGINAHCFQNENAAFRETSKRIFDWNFSRKVQMASYFFAPFLVKMFKWKFLEPNAAEFMQDVFWNAMNERESSNAYRGDLIDVLVQIRKQNSDQFYEFDKEMLVAQAAQFFIAGFETTGSTISFTLYELGLNYSVQNRLRNEIRSVLTTHGNLTYEAIQDMNYLDMTVKETLRKYPVVPFLDRRCTKTYKIPGTDVIIERGVPIYIPLLGLHYDPEYFPDPQQYDPERFNLENRNSRPPFTYMPFGEGPHNCIGARFGVMSTKVALIRILAEFEVEPCSIKPLKFDPKGFLIAPEHGVNLRFKKHVPLV